MMDFAGFALDLIREPGIAAFFFGMAWALAFAARWAFAPKGEGEGEGIIGFINAMLKTLFAGCVLALYGFVGSWLFATNAQDRAASVVFFAFTLYLNGGWLMKRFTPAPQPSSEAK